MGSFKKCPGKEGGKLCSIRDNCKRFTSDSEGIQQFWTRMESGAINGRCSNYVYNGDLGNAKSTNMVLEFEDHGQPFTQWTVDFKTGKILSSNPNGNDIWTNYFVADPDDLRKGSRVLVYHAQDRIKYWDNVDAVKCQDICHKVKSIRKEASDVS